MLELKIQEAEAKNVGRGIARLDPEDMKLIGVSTGDIVEILGKAKAVGKVMPSFPEKRGRKILQIDGILRSNAGVGLDDKVTVQKTPCLPAKSLSLTPVGTTQISEKDCLYIRSKLEGIPVLKGNEVRISLIGTRFQSFRVLSVQPEGAVIVTSETKLRLEGEGVVKDSRKSSVSYEDIGGLGTEIQKIREMIELPLKFPQIFERLGIEPPKGVLLYGPPGTGKTLLARAIANESGASFYTVSGPEIFHKFYGESEAHLRKVFEAAQASAPSIVFIDELDAVASKREGVREDQQVERRVSAQLLALMDGLKDRGNVVVIGATNIPNVIDPALRRPGRFDREIAIGIPDQQGRLEILEIHTRGMPLAIDIDLKKLAETTHGFVGADLGALCREAAIKALRTIIPDIDFTADRIPYEKLIALEVTWKNFLEALNEIGPSALREIFIEVPNVEWEDIGGLENVKQVLKETIEWPIRYPEVFEKSDTLPPKGILLCGPPGTGKTLVAKAVARESGVNFISVKGPELISKWIGESEKGVREVFKKARQASPCIIFFDEIDAVAPKRSSMDSSHVSERTISQLLTEIDGIETLRQVVVLAATNRLDILDEALLRSGRFDFQLELPIPDEKTRLKIFEIHTRRKPVAKNVDWKKLASETTGLTGADIESICRQASMLAIREFIDEFGQLNSQDLKESLESFEIGAQHFESALHTVSHKTED